MLHVCGEEVGILVKICTMRDHMTEYVEAAHYRASLIETRSQGTIKQYVVLSIFVSEYNECHELGRQSNYKFVSEHRTLHWLHQGETESRMGALWNGFLFNRIPKSAITWGDKHKI